MNATSEKRTRKVKTMNRTDGKFQGSSETNICFSCQNAIRGCSWSRNFTPIEGWTAVKSKTVAGSYHITACPEFVEDEPRNPDIKAAAIMGEEEEQRFLRDPLAYLDGLKGPRMSYKRRVRINSTGETIDEDKSVDKFLYSNVGGRISTGVLEHCPKNEEGSDV